MLNKSNEFQVKINKFPFDDEHVIELPMGIPSAKTNISTNLRKNTTTFICDVSWNFGIFFVCRKPRINVELAVCYLTQAFLVCDNFYIWKREEKKKQHTPKKYSISHIRNNNNICLVLFSFDFNEQNSWNARLFMHGLVFWFHFH